MKTALSLLALIASISFGHAGGFGGPPPFTNSSPLPSGTDGTYEAAVRGQNLTGIFGFQIQNGVQTAAQNENTWVIFVRGNVYEGTTQASIAGNSNITGVLDGNTSTVGENGQITLPVIISSYGANGYFTGQLAMNSAAGLIKGKGLLSSVGQDVTTLSYTGFFTVVIGFTPPPGNQPIERQVIATQTEIIPKQEGNFGNVAFTFQGTRLNLGTTSSSSSSSSTSTAQ